MHALPDSRDTSARPSVHLVSGDLFGDFERNAVASAHYAAAQRHDKLASDRREWAKERGPLWQRYLAQAILCERKARQHRERAHAILHSPNIGHEPRGSHSQ